MKIIGPEIKNLPWEECPKGYGLPIWRYSGNPVIKRHVNKTIARAFNSALAPYKGEFIGVFRGDGYTDIPHLYVGHSKDGINFEIEQKEIHFVDEEGNPIPDTCNQYDPRVIPFEDYYFVVFCDDYAGPIVGIAKTHDFKTFVKLKYPLLPYNRNGVLFPRKIDDKYYLLSRPCSPGHNKFGDIFLTESKDMSYWGNHKIIARAGPEYWCNIKLGAGPAPIETDEGWLVFFHGVGETCNGIVYSLGGMILDKNDPSKVLYRCKNYMLTPEMPYETAGFVNNVVFPTCALCDAKTGRIAIYYGAADSCTGLAFTTVDRVVEYIKNNGR